VASYYCVTDLRKTVQIWTAEMEVSVSIVAKAVSEVEASYGDVVQMWGSLEIVLVAHAQDAAKALYERLGDRVNLVLGSRQYPSGDWWPSEGAAGAWVASTELDNTSAIPRWLDLRLDVPRSIRIGPDQHGTATLANRGKAEAAIVSSGPPVLLEGCLTARNSRAALSSPGGFRHLMAISTVVSPGEEVRMPVVFGVGATRRTPGYTVEPGEYELVVVVPISEGPASASGNQIKRCRSKGTAITVCQ
jgi:hypothetical protein